MTSLFGGSGAVNVNVSGTLVPQDFTPTDGQSLLTLTLFTYTPGTNSLLVFVNGDLQIPGTDFSETSSSSLTMTNALSSLDRVRVIGFPLANFFQAGVGTNLTDIPTVAVVQNALYSWGGTSTGGANAIVVTTTPVPAAAAAGQVIRFIANANNTGAATLKNGTLTSKSLKKAGTSGLVDLIANDIIAGCAYQVVDDGTYYQLSGGVGGGSSLRGGVAMILLNAMTGPLTIAAGETAIVGSGLIVSQTITNNGRLVVL